MFSDRVKVKLKRLKENNESFALFCINIHIQNLLEHRLRDELLAKASSRLNLFIEQGDFLEQVSEEEFIIVLYNILDIEDIIQFSERIITAFKIPFVIEGCNLYCMLNIGISVYPDDSENIEIVIKNANTAMKYAKEKGINNYQLYTCTMDIEGYQKFVLENDICKALDRNEFRVYYHPRFNSETNEMMSAEAFFYWHHPHWGIIGLEEVIPLLQQHGLVNNVGKWLLKNIYRQANLWKKVGVPPIKISINLSNIQSLQNDTLQKMISVLYALGVQITMEQLETNRWTKSREFISAHSQSPRKYYCISLEYPLAAEMTILKIGQKLVKVGSARISITDIDAAGLRFLSTSKLPVKSDLILGIETEIFNMNIKLQGSLVWNDEIKENIYEYELQFLLNELEKQRIVNLLNKLRIHLKYNLGKLNYRFVTKI